MNESLFILISCLIFILIILLLVFLGFDFLPLAGQIELDL